MDIDKDNIIRDVYYTPSGYSSMRQTLDDARKKDKSIKMEDVKKLIPEKLEDLRETQGLEISDDEALLGLRYFHWNADRFQD